MEGEDDTWTCPLASTHHTGAYTGMHAYTHHIHVEIFLIELKETYRNKNNGEQKEFLS